MGTYMSAYLEVDHGIDLAPFTDPTQIYSLTDGSFSFNKDYEVFDALAHGRSILYPVEDQDPKHRPLFAARGMPMPCGPEVAHDYYRLVAEPPDLPNDYFWPNDRCVSPAQASEWLRTGKCHESEAFQHFNCPPCGPLWWPVVSTPGLHNASWLRLDEFDTSLAHHGLELSALRVEYRVLRAAFSLLVDEYGLSRVRLVLWFS
jgi:hypothetical protein